MAQIKAVSYEEQRADHFRKLMEKMQRKIDWWQSAGRSLNRNYNSRWHNECSEAGMQYSFYQDALEALTAQPKWISVEERLPEPDKDVLTLKNRKRVRIGYYSEDCEEWVINDMVAYDEDITHWMPLPSTEGIE